MACIPASPSNNASSLYMEAQLSSTGGGTATASTPFFGSTVQNLPGTANGVPPQFGLKDVATPHHNLPRMHRLGYVAPNLGDVTGQNSPGGFVLDSRPGLYDSVLVFDYKSLYPSIIRTFLIDPAGLIEGLAHPSDDASVPGKA